VAILTGGRLMDEDYYALSKLARTVLRTNDLDHRRSSGAEDAEAYVAARPMSVTYRDLERAETVVVAGLDAEQEVPILHLRLRKAAKRGAAIWVIGPRVTRLHDVASHLLVAPGDELAALAAFTDASAEVGGELGGAVAALRAAGDRGVVVAGERLGGTPGAAAAARAAAIATGARFTYVTRRANDRGALRAGVHPDLLPGGRLLPAEGEVGEVEAVWGPIMDRDRGRDAIGILKACADREIDVLFLVGVDPLADLPDAALALRALQNTPVTVVQSLELGSLEPFASAFLPAAAFLEKDGHLTDWEGRGQRLRPVRASQGISRPDWEIFAGLAAAMGGDLGFETLDELHEEMGRLLGPREGLATAPPAPPSAGTLASSEGLRLFSYPLLVDEGRLSEAADELKAALEEPVHVEVHVTDAARLGLADGDLATVRTAAGEATLPVRVSEAVAPGSVFVPTNQPGLSATTLLSGGFVTDAALEPAGSSTEAPATSEEVSA
jgi:NADH-quinone oxidoreductase subunit G